MTYVTEKALLGRINRRFVHSGYRVRKSRPSMIGEFGRYHMVESNNIIVNWHIGLVEMAKELNVLGHNETVPD